MAAEETVRKTDWLVPWTDDPQAWIGYLRKQIPCDALVIGVLNVHEPRKDELILAHGWTAPELASWCEVGYQNDRLFRAVLRAGLATGDPQRPDMDSSLTHGKHALSLALPESFAQDRWWWLLLSRHAGPFTPEEQQLAGLVLRYGQMRFALPDEPGMRRLVLGHDHRVILADLRTQADRLAEPGWCNDLLRDFEPILNQRYPNLPDHQTRDLAVKVAGRPWWACFRRSRTAEHTRLAYWYTELRPLDDDDIPPLGLVKDDRIAQAVAYIHEHFAQAPSLSDVAHMVHISPFHFHRLFTKQVGVSPKQYVQKKQLQVAKWLLRKGGVSIGEIAQRTGFSSHGHFTATFHRVVGQSPSEYRDKL